MFRKIRQEAEGQALVEFALVIVILLLVIFIIVDGGRLFQAWLTVQNSARTAARYAVTGQYDNTGNFITPECPAGTPVDRWQVCSIKDQAFQSSSGLNIDPAAGPTEPLAFGTQICQPDSCPPEGTGGPGEPTRVSVFYNAELITPLLRPFAEFVRVTGQVEVVTAQYDQVSPGDIVIANVGAGVEGPPFPNAADIGITKGPENGVGKVMETVNYTMTVKNYGPFGTPSIEVLDLLPSGTVSLTNYTITDGVNAIDKATCSFSQLDQQLTCTIPYLNGSPINPGAAYIEISLLIAPEDLENNPYQPTVVVTNTASVFNQIATIDPNPDNNESSVNTTLSRWYDLELTKSYAPGQSATVNLGEPVDFLIHVENIGPSTAVDAVITDTLPAGLLFDSIVSATINSNCAQSGNGIQCLPDPLANGDFVEVTIRAIVTQVPASVPENTATVLPANPTDEDNTNNSDTADPTVITAPDLLVTKSIVDTMYTEVGGVYFIQVSNNGDGTATNVVLTDDMQPDAGVTFDFEALTGTNPSKCQIQSGEDILCQGFDVAAGDTWLLQVPIVPHLPDGTDTGSIDNVVNVTSNSGLYTAAPASASTTVLREYDLAVAKFADTDDIDADLLRYEVTVTNNGPSTSLDFDIVDQLDVETEGTGVSAVVTDVDGKYIGSTGACSVDPDDNEIVCQVTPMPAGATASFVVQVDLTDFSGRIRNHATVADKDNHPDEERDSFVTGWLIYPYALSIDKEGESTGEQGEVSEYTIMVRNHGLLPATFAISDVLETQPLDLIDIVSISSSSANCPATSAGSFECTISDLDPGDSVFITAAVTPASGGFLTNTATIDAPNSVTWLYPYADSVKTTFSPMANLDATLSSAPSVSETVVLRLDVTNIGPQPAEQILVTDSIDIRSGTVLSLKLVSSSDLSAYCDQVTGSFSSTVSVDCDLNSLGVGETATYFVVVVFADESGNEFTSEALAESETFDPQTKNNTDLYEWP